MKLRFIPGIVLTMFAALFLSMTVGPVEASTFNFSFTNTANGGGIVTGTIVLNASDTAATSLVVISNTAGFGIGEYVGAPNSNSFTVTSGQLTDVVFEDFGTNNTSPAQTCCSLSLDGSDAGLTDASNGVSSIATDLTFSATPLPAALPLFATGLGGLGLLGWRRKRKAHGLQLSTP